MKSLVNKELKLAASPLSWWFIVFAAMTMLPNYPILVGAVFVCLGLFYSFLSTRETNDILFTALLPVKKGDVVRAKYIFCCMIEGIAFAAMAVLTAVRMLWLRDVPVYLENAMMNATPAYLGYVLLIFTLFNRVFVGGFFRTAYVVGKPLIRFMIEAFALIILTEILHHISGLVFLNSATENLGIQFGLLALCALIYVTETRSDCQRAVEDFEELDL